MPSSNVTSKNDYWLVTGMTGLVGEYLLKDLLQAGFRLAVVARASRKQTATQRIESILGRWEKELGCQLQRPVVLEGDVGLANLGLDADSLRWISGSCSHLLHNAAVLNFFGPSREGEPWKTNVAGTKNVLQLLKDTGIEDLHYVSTAYVCGDRSTTVFEHDFDCGQKFRNDYENSKWVAEQLVRQAELINPPTIYRPVVISGDSTNGYTSTYHGLYLYLRMMAMLVPQQERDSSGKIVTKIQLPMSGHEPRNIVPVEWVSQVMTHLLSTPNAHGKTFHLAPPQGITPNELVQHCYQYFGSAGVEFCGNDNLNRQADNDFAAKVFEAIRIYQDYEISDPKFDTTNLNKYAGHIDCPELTQDVIQRYLVFGENDKWGKIKRPKFQCDISGQPLIQRLSDEIMDLSCQLAPTSQSARHHNDSAKSAQQVRFRICFDLLGPGGGAWTVEIPQNGCATIIPGIVGNPDVTMQMNVDRLQEWLSSDLVSKRQTAQRWIQRAETARASGRITVESDLS